MTDFHSEQLGHDRSGGRTSTSITEVPADYTVVPPLFKKWTLTNNNCRVQVSTLATSSAYKLRDKTRRNFFIKM